MSSSDSVTDLIGRTFDGRYRIEKLLGKGGMGAVYLARQVAMDKPVALKVLARHLSDDDNQIRRFEVEALASSKLKHPNTIRVFDFGRSKDGHLFIAMEYLEGNELSRVIKTHGPMDPLRVAHIAQQVVKSVGEAHSKGLVHRDLKPDNIFLCDFFGEQDFVKVLDFGIAKFAEGPDEGSLTQTGFICGTPLYIAPEQAMGTRITARTDLYSLGIVMFEMLAGKPPFKAETPIAIVMKQIHDAPPRINSVNPLARIPPALERLVMQLMAKDPESRPADADVVSETLGALLRQSQSGLGRTSGDHYKTIGESPQEEPTLVSGKPGVPDPFEAIPTAAIPAPTAAMLASEAMFSNGAVDTKQTPRGAGPPTGARVRPRTASAVRAAPGPPPRPATGPQVPPRVPTGAQVPTRQRKHTGPQLPPPIPQPPPLPVGAAGPRDSGPVVVPPPMPKEAMGPPTAPGVPAPPPGGPPTARSRPSGPPTRDASTGAIPNPTVGPGAPSTDVPVPVLVLAAVVALALAGGAVWYFLLGGAAGSGDVIAQVESDGDDTVGVEPPAAAGLADGDEDEGNDDQDDEDDDEDEPEGNEKAPSEGDVKVAEPVAPAAEVPSTEAPSVGEPDSAEVAGGGAAGELPAPANIWSVELRSSPPGAEVLIDSDVLGNTPVSVGLSPGTRLDVQLRMAGYEPVGVTIAPADEAAASAGVDVELKRQARKTPPPTTGKPASKRAPAKGTSATSQKSTSKTETSKSSTTSKSGASKKAPAKKKPAKKKKKKAIQWEDF